MSNVPVLFVVQAQIFYFSEHQAFFAREQRHLPGTT